MKPCITTWPASVPTDETRAGCEQGDAEQDGGPAARVSVHPWKASSIDSASVP